MNAEMRMYQALVSMPEAITDYAAKVNHIADWADVTWAAAEAWLQDWQARQEPQGYISDDPMIDAEVKNDLGAEVPYNGGEGESTYFESPASINDLIEKHQDAVFARLRQQKGKIIDDLAEKYLPDPINPPHYQQGNVECIDAICDALGDEQFKGFLRGNAMKYLWRCELKGDPVENAQKAEWYIKRLIAEYELDEETRRDVND